MKEKGREYVRSSLSWTDKSSIGIIIHQNKLIAEYAIGSDTEREEIHDTIHFDSVPNNYGGIDRLYFECPFCWRRSRFLYLHKKHFKCRKCAKLNYCSQQLTKNEDIPIYKIRKLLRDKFGIIENLSPFDTSYYRPPRPKGMHQKTYDRLSIELLKLQIQYENESRKTFMRIAGILHMDI